MIRPIAICVFRHEGRILVFEGNDPKKQQSFYRPLGGGIEFGEHSAAAVERELGEELGVAVDDLRFLGVIENIFTYGSQTGHEIIMVYDGAFVDRSLYERPVIEAMETDGSLFRAVWVRLTDCAEPDAPPLYPTGLLDLLTTQA